MERTQKFFMCKDCGNIVGVINNTGIPMHCCNKKMDELTPNIINSNTKSVHFSKPIFEFKQHDNNSASVIINQDYLDSNSICWAYLNTKKGGQRKNLLDGDFPILNFQIIDDTIVSAYFYCSNYGLFRWDIDKK